MVNVLFFPFLNVGRQPAGVFQKRLEIRPGAAPQIIKGLQNALVALLQFGKALVGQIQPVAALVFRLALLADALLLRKAFQAAAHRFLFHAAALAEHHRGILLRPQIQQGQKDARNFFDQLMFSCQHGPFVLPPVKAPARRKTVYQPVLPTAEKNRKKDVVIVTNCAADDENLANMIADFRAALPCESRVVNLRQFPFDGGCLGCFGCAITGKCVYKDGFDEFLRSTIQTADGFVYAFTIADHYTQSSFKCFDDRQFCNGHRTVTHGTPIAYLVSGDYRYEPNLRMILEGRAEVGGNYLCGVATDEGDAACEIRQLAENLTFAMDKKLTRPANFYGVGGMKIFRDLIYVRQGLMKADHKFYKQQGIYDFPQKQKKRILQMKLVGAMLAVPSIQKQAKGKMTEAIVGPCRTVIEQAQGGNRQ